MRIGRAWDQTSIHQKLARSVRCSVFPPKITVLVQKQYTHRPPGPRIGFHTAEKYKKSVTANIFLKVHAKMKCMKNCAFIDFSVFQRRAQLCVLTKATSTHRSSFWAEKRYSARIALIFGGWRFGPKLFQSA